MQSVTDEVRIAPRRRVLKTGAITFAYGAAISCAVRNISATGASLEVESPVGIPSDFDLVIETDAIKRSCRVVWRKERRIGVTFVDCS